jgi:hypothetical protein
MQVIVEKTIQYPIQIPESWDQVTPSLFRKVFPVLFKTFPGPPEGKTRVELVKRMVNKKLFKLFEPEQIWDFSNAISFLWKKPCPVPIIPSFRFLFTRYYLPSGYLHNASYIEFMFADAKLSSLADAENLNSEELDQLIATLCRPQKMFWWIRRRLPSNDGDNRQKFNAELMKARAIKFRKLPVHWKLYVLSFFIACKDAIINDPAYSLVFPKKKKKDDEDQDSGSWKVLLKDVADTRIYGNYDETAYYSLHTILDNLQSELKKQEKMKREMRTKK